MKDFSGIDVTYTDDVTEFIYYLYADAKNRDIKRIFDPNCKLIDLGIKEKDIIAINEVLNSKGKVTIEQFYSFNSELLGPNKMKALMVAKRWTEFQKVYPSEEDFN